MKSLLQRLRFLHTEYQGMDALPSVVSDTEKLVAFVEGVAIDYDFHGYGRTLEAEQLLKDIGFELDSYSKIIRVSKK